MKYLVTGGAGFIGSNFIRHLLEKKLASEVVNLDKLTYAGNLENLKEIEGDSRYRFIQGDICDPSLVDSVFKETYDVVVNFAAESHVDRSIHDAGAFIKTDVEGAYLLLEACRKKGVGKFVQISTDEVYGSILKGSFKETDPLMPSNPYSASKAGADRLAYSYWKTYQLPVLITRASNNFGPYQYPEKIIPLFVTNALEDQPLPLYGDGLNVRDWLYVRDHCEALSFLLEKGELGEVYNIGGGHEWTNRDLTHFILKHLKKAPSLIKKVPDRLAHDRRYSLDSTKINNLGWKGTPHFEKTLSDTIDWYVQNESWWKNIKSGTFKEYYQRQYKTVERP